METNDAEAQLNAEEPELAEVPEEVLELPVAELHLHIEGTLEPELIFALAERNGIQLPYADLDELRSRYEFRDLQSFLDLYYANMAVLQTEQDFADMTRAYLSRAALAGVRHAEIMLDPQAHLSRGISLETCVNGVASVLAGSFEEFGISTLLIAAFLRDLSEDSALEVLEQLLAMGAPIAGIGLDSAEVGNPPAKFQRLFARAKDAGLHRIAHAGEEGPPSYIIDALDILEVERIDHGIRCMEDPDLVERLVDELDAADRLPAVQRPAPGGGHARCAPAAGHARRRPERECQLGRSRVFRRLRGRQLRPAEVRDRPVRVRLRAAGGELDPFLLRQRGAQNRTAGRTGRLRTLTGDPTPTEGNAGSPTAQ